MSKGEIHGWHYATREPVRVHWQDGRITFIERSNQSPPQTRWIAPGLFDLQINGFGGVDFQSGTPDVDALLRACRGLNQNGCTRFLLTIVTDEWRRMLDRLKRFRELRGDSKELQRAIVGWHIEGPFLSDKPGFSGAHDASVMVDPAPERIRELREAAGNDLVLLTLAPERLDGIAAISLAVSLGMKVSLGHTDAQHKRLLQAIKAGAVGFTHLANGCPRELDRHDNILWRVFETKGLKISLIPDAVHVSPPLFRLIHRMFAPDEIYYTTDAMAAAGAPPGRYSLGKLSIEVGEDRIVRKPGSALFAGSALEPLQGVFRATEMLGCSWQEAWPRLSDIPARMMGLPAGLEAGMPATFCVLDVTPENWLESFQVYVEGNMVPMEGD